jgi:hypothetical protein
MHWKSCSELVTSFRMTPLPSPPPSSHTQAAPETFRLIVAAPLPDVFCPTTCISSLNCQTSCKLKGPWHNRCLQEQSNRESFHCDSSSARLFDCSKSRVRILQKRFFMPCAVTDALARTRKRWRVAHLQQRVAAASQPGRFATVQRHTAVYCTYANYAKGH